MRSVILTLDGAVPDRALPIVRQMARRDGRLIVVATGRPPQAEQAQSPGLTRRLLGAAPCPVVAVPAAA
jgi:nucleotide-binding universal stress UspA family protein